MNFYTERVWNFNEFHWILVFPGVLLIENQILTGIAEFRNVDLDLYCYILLLPLWSIVNLTN